MVWEIVVAVIIAGASYVQAKKAQKKAKEATEGVEANIESNSKEIPVVYGERRVGGVRVYIDTSRDTKHKYLYMVLAMAEGEVESITDIKIDDIPITDSRFRIGGIDNNPNFWYQVFTGTDTQTVSTLIRDGVSYDIREDVWVDPYYNQHDKDPQIPDIAYPWSVNHRLQGIAYLALKFKWDENAYQGIPDVTAVVKGKKVYDPRTQTTAWSDNPALCILDYLTNEKYGKGLSLNELDLDAFGQAATDCEDFTVTPFTGSTATHQLFTMDAVIDTKNKIIENLNDMLIGCRGFLPFTQGKYRLIIDQPKNSVFTFTQDHIIDGISIKGSRKEDRFNQVKVNFFNKGQEYKEDQAIYPETNSTLYQQYLAEDQGEPLVEELDIFSFDNVYSAREMARLVLERSRKNLGIAFNATSEALVLDIGDVFAITHPTPAWTNKLFQVQELSFNYDGTVSVSAVEYDADLYTYDEPDEEQPYVGSRLPDTSEVDPVTNVSATAGSYIDTDGKTIGYIDVSWTPPNDEIVDRYDVKVEYNSKEEVYNTAATEHRIKPTEDGVDYTISVRAINGINVRSVWTTIAAVSSVADTTAPSDITGTSISSGLQTIDLSWTNPSDDDFDLVRIKVANTNIEPASHSFEVRSNEFLHEVGAYNATRHYWVAPVDRTGNVGNYVYVGAETTGQPDYNDLTNTPTIPTIPEVAGTFYISLGDSNAPTDTEFNTAVGRDPLENDFVIVSYPDGTGTSTKGYNYNGDPLAWTEVTEYIDGSMIVTGSLSASDITTGTLNANDVTISNLTIAGSQLPNNIAYIRDTKNIAVIINEDVSGSNVGEAVLVGYTDGVADKSVNGFITYKGTKYTIDVTQGNTSGVTILTAASNKDGYIVYDSTESNKFTTSTFGDRNVVFAWFDGTNWRYDPNNTTGTIFTPTDTDLALGTMSTGSSDFITSADLFFEVVKLTEAQEKGTTINYGYTEFTTTDEVTGIVTQYTNDQGFISSVSWDDVLSKPTDLVVDGDITDVVRDSDITDVVREGDVYSNLLIDSDERVLTIPYPTNEAGAIEYTINSSVARSEALIVLDITDAEGVTIPNGVQWSLNGVYQSQLNGADNARIEYKFVVPLISGNNSIKIWSGAADGGTVHSVKAYTYESGGGQWFRLSGRANTNAPSDEDFKLAFGRYPRPRDVILVQATSGATASYYFNKTLNAWDNAEAIVHGDLIVSESITALGEVTAGTFSLGNGAFTVNSSGQLNATGAIIDGNITANSLDVEDATVTGTFVAPIGWSNNIYSGVINRGNLNESVKDLIDERIAEVTGGISGDFGQDDGYFSHIAQGNPDPDDPIVLNITHETGKNLTVELSGSRSWNREFVGLPETDMGVSITLERSPSGANTWTTLTTLTDSGSSITTSQTQITGTTYAYSISIYHVLTDDQASGNYDYRARTTVAGAAYNVSIPLQLTVVEPATVGAGNADTLDNQDGTYYLDYNNFTNTPDLSLKADLAGDTFTGTVISTKSTIGSIGGNADMTNAGFLAGSTSNGIGIDGNEIVKVGGDKFFINQIGDNPIEFHLGVSATNSKKLSITTGGIEVSGTISATGYNASNWDTAYGWGDHSTAGYETATTFTSNAYLSGRDTTAPTTTGDGRGVTFNYLSSSSLDKPVGVDHALMTMAYSNAWQTQIAQDWRNSGRMFIRGQNNGTWSDWEQVWSSVDFANNSANWDTAYTYSQVGHLPLSGGTLTGDITAVNATLSGGDLRIYNDASNYGRILFGESATDGNVIIEYDGTGSGDTNYLNFYSDVSGWMTKGSSLNIQPSTGNVAVGSNTYTDKFNVTGTIRADSYKIGTTEVIDSSRNVTANQFVQSGSLGSQMYSIELTRGGTQIWSSQPYLRLGTSSSREDLNITDTATSINVMNGYQTEGAINIGRSDGTARYHTIYAYNDGTASNNYLKFNVHNGTVDSTTNALTLWGDGQAEVSGLKISSVGGIKQVAGEFGIGSGGVGLHFNNSGSNILPYSYTSNAWTNGTANLGHPSYKFKDFHLSGTVYSTNGYRIGSTLVIDSSRNLTNIGTGSFSGDVSLTNNAYLYLGTSTAGSNFIQDAQIGWGDVIKVRRAGVDKWQLQEDSGVAKFTTAVNAISGFEVDGTTVIDSSRNLTNIGSIDSTGRLTITNTGAGDATWTGGILIKNTNATAGEPAIAFQNTAMGSNYWIVGSNQDNEMHFSYGTAFQDGNTKVVIKSDGKMGIGVGAGTLTNQLTVGGNTQINGALTASGNITAYSDITLKDNITEIDNALDKVNSIRGVTYDRIDQDNARHAGVIAQEVEEVLPEVVHTDGDGIKSVAYGNMVGLLIEAIKELKSEIEELKNVNSN